MMLEEKMGEIIRKYGLSCRAVEKMQRSIGVERVEVKGSKFTCVNYDCVEETARMEENSIDLIHTSIPFSNHYEYTPSYNDFGHNEDTVRFFEQMDFLTPQLLRILKPGRVAALYRKYSRGTVYSYEEHIKLAKSLDESGRLPASFMVVAPRAWNLDIWDDINRMRTLNTSQSRKREQLHVCPLQLDIVDRIINRYSNPGELVLDPFGGLGTVALQAMKAGRRGYTIELNHDYFRDAVGYLQAEEDKQDMPTLFDLLEEG